MPRKTKVKKTEQVEQKEIEIPKVKSKRQEMLELALADEFDCAIDDMGLLRFYVNNNEEMDKARSWGMDHIHDFSWGISMKNNSFLQKVED